MYPIGLFETMLAIYGSYRLLEDVFFPKNKNVEFIELNELQYQQVRNIIDIDNQTNEPLPPYTERIEESNINNNIETDNNLNVDENTNLIDNNTSNQNREEQLRNKLAAPFH